LLFCGQFMVKGYIRALVVIKIGNYYLML
jgi:hypothetical protein